MVQGDGEHERPRLRIAEVLRSLNRIGGSSAARLRIVAGPLGPGLEIPAGGPQVDAHDSERALDPGRVQRIGNRDLAELHVAVRLETRFLDARERARRVALPVPVLPDRDGHPRSRTDNRPVEPADLSEDLRIPGRRRTVAEPHMPVVYTRPMAPLCTLPILR